MQQPILTQIHSLNIRNMPTYICDVAEAGLTNNLKYFTTLIPLDNELFKKWFNVVKNLLMECDKREVVKRYSCISGFFDSRDFDYLGFDINLRKVNDNYFDGICFVNDANKRFIYRYHNITPQHDTLLLTFLKDGIDSSIVCDNHCACQKEKLNKHIRNFAYRIQNNKLEITCLPCAMAVHQEGALETARYIFGRYSFAMQQLNRLVECNQATEKMFKDFNNNFNVWFKANRYFFFFIKYYQKAFRATTSNFEGTDFDNQIDLMLGKVLKREQITPPNNFIDWVEDYKTNYVLKGTNGIKSADLNDFIAGLFAYQSLLLEHLKFNQVAMQLHCPQTLLKQK